MADRADARLGNAAEQALDKIGAVLPCDLRDQLESNGLFIAPGRPIEAGTIDLGIIRQAIRREHKIEIDYVTAEGKESIRTIWPFIVGFFDQVRIVAAWCELREDFRHFRADRIRAVTETGKRYPRRRPALIAEWRAMLDLPEPRKLPESCRK